MEALLIQNPWIVPVAAFLWAYISEDNRGVVEAAVWATVVSLVLAFVAFVALGSVWEGH